MPSLQPNATSLIFIGGIKDSGKSDLAKKLGTDPGFRVARLSDYFGAVLDGWPEKTDLTTAVVYVDWKRLAEGKAIDRLCSDIPNWRRDANLKTLIINSHYATYSPCGFMMGLDPESLRILCDKANLFLPNSEGRVAVVHVDISVSDVLVRRERRWTHQTDDFPTGPGLTADLEFNRLYALQYYNCLVSFLGYRRVAYYRSVIDFKDVGDYHKELTNTAAFDSAYNELKTFLNRYLLPSTGKQV